MTTISPSTKKMPLPIQIFYGAMEQQVPLADYARNIDLAPDILHQALAGHFQSTHSEEVNALARAIKRDPEQIDLTPVRCDEPFSIWLKRNMEGITQHGLRVRAQLDTKTLKRFLNGDLLPDSDQAERISRALYIDRIEVARVITANIALGSPSIARQEATEAVAIRGQSVIGTRRKRTGSQPASAEPAVLLLDEPPTSIEESVPAMVEPDTAAPGDLSTGRKRPKRSAKTGVQVQTPIGAEPAMHLPQDEPSSSPPVEIQEIGRDCDSVSAAVPLHDDPLLQPAPESKRSRKSRSRGQPDQANISGLNGVVDESQPILEESDSKLVIPAAIDQAASHTLPVAAGIVAEKETRTRRPKQVIHDSVAATEHAPGLTELKTADEKPIGEIILEERSTKRAGSRRKQAAIEATADIPTSDMMRASSAAETVPSKPDEQADSSTEQTSPLVTAELAVDPAILQLSPDEVRLIRHWRRLHPHGRRAAIHYIGSLLLDD